MLKLANKSITHFYLFIFRNCLNLIKTDGKKISQKCKNRAELEKFIDVNYLA